MRPLSLDERLGSPKCNWGWHYADIKPYHYLDPINPAPYQIASESPWHATPQTQCRNCITLRIATCETDDNSEQENDRLLFCI